MFRLALLFSVVAVAYDALAAGIARALSISYDTFAILAFVLFFLMGLLAGRKAHAWTGVLPVAIAALVEATAGWYVAAAIGPGSVPGATREWIVYAGLAGAAYLIVAGAAGVAIAKRIPSTTR
ncbi:MAG TPA: hypothetical protein VMH02_00735 [Verrucomicrobiae bacterium]|nr:hypothetical protein [Verrucomicrobiae bacterium]